MLTEYIILIDMVAFGQKQAVEKSRVDRTSLVSSIDVVISYLSKSPTRRFFEYPIPPKTNTILARHDLNERVVLAHLIITSAINANLIDNNSAGKLVEINQYISELAKRKNWPAEHVKIGTVSAVTMTHIADSNTKPDFKAAVDDFYNQYTSILNPLRINLETRGGHLNLIRRSAVEFYIKDMKGLELLRSNSNITPKKISDTEVLILLLRKSSLTDWFFFRNV